MWKWKICNQLLMCAMLKSYSPRMFFAHIWDKRRRKIDRSIWETQMFGWKESAHKLQSLFGLTEKCGKEKRERKLELLWLIESIPALTVCFDFTSFSLGFCCTFVKFLLYWGFLTFSISSFLERFQFEKPLFLYLQCIRSSQAKLFCVVITNI